VGKVRVAIIGVGNCASALVQGVHYYGTARVEDTIAGLLSVELGGYHIGEIEFSAAFDVDPAKVGQDLGEAISVHPNNTFRFATVPVLGVPVSPGRTHDSISSRPSGPTSSSGSGSSEVAHVLRETTTDVVVNFLPVGSEQATKWYVEQVLSAGCALVNCAPVSIAREAYWQHRFQEAGLPLIGDDVRSQVSVMSVHRVLTRLFRYQGLRLDRTSQLNMAGNADLSNLLERVRSDAQRPPLSEATQLDYPFAEDDAYLGPTAQVPWLQDRRWAYMYLQGRTFGDVPFSVDLKIETWDAPSSAGHAVDAARCAKIALDRRISGVLAGPSALFMTLPPWQFGDDEARQMVGAFIRAEAPGSGPEA